MTDLSAAGVRALHPWLPRGLVSLAAAESAGRLRVRAVGDGRSAPPVAAVVGGAERAPGTVCRRRGRPGGMRAAKGGRVVAAPRGGGHDVLNRP